jgi:hypothetical protein
VEKAAITLAKQAKEKEAASEKLKEVQTSKAKKLVPLKRAVREVGTIVDNRLCLALLTEEQVLRIMERIMALRLALARECYRVMGTGFGSSDVMLTTCPRLRRI